MNFTIQNHECYSWNRESSSCSNEINLWKQGICSWNDEIYSRNVVTSVQIHDQIQDFEKFIFFNLRTLFYFQNHAHYSRNN